MTEEIKNFIEKYNKHVQWDNEIIKSLGKKNIPKDIIENYFAGEPITEDGYDIENARLYEYGKDDNWAGTLELHVFSNKTYHTVYFWIHKDYTEEEYKTHRIELIKNEMNKKLDELFEQIKGLTAEFKQYNKLKKMIAKINGY